MGGGCIYSLPLEAERHQHGDIHHCSLLGLAKDLHHKGVPRHRCVGWEGMTLRGLQSRVVQWNLSIKDTLNEGHLSNEDTVSCPNHIELYTNPPLN